MRLAVTAISDPKQLDALRDSLDDFMEKCCENPFYLSCFLQRQMNHLHLPIILLRWF